MGGCLFGKICQGIAVREFRTDAWDDFMARASKGGQLSSFDAFGANASQWRNDYINRAAVMDAAMTDYLRSIGAEGVKITESILAKINSDLACFFSDTLLNDLNTLIERSGVPQPMRAAGPCETAMQRVCRGQKILIMNRPINA